MIQVSIDVTKIDKSRFFVKQNGAKILDLILIESKDRKYGNDYFVKQGRTKAERDKGLKPQLPILGNAKIIQSRGGGRSASQPQQAAYTEEDDW